MRSLLLGLLSLLPVGPWPGGASAEPKLAPEVAEVRDCAERNLPQRTARQKLVLERVVAGSEARRLEATLLWKRGEDGLSRVRVDVDAPPTERGTAFLLVEREGEVALVFLGQRRDRHQHVGHVDALVIGDLAADLDDRLDPLGARGGNPQPDLAVVDQ